MKQSTYYFAIVRNYYLPQKPKTLQVVQDYDSFSCEILASPAILEKQFSTVKHVIRFANDYALSHDCTRIEMICAEKQGSYKDFPVRPVKVYPNQNQACISFSKPI